MAESSPKGYLSELTLDFNTFLKNNKFTDVTFWCKDGQVDCHKMMLSDKSSLMQNLFNESLFDSDIICPDFTAETVSKMLKLLYTGQTAYDSDVELVQIRAITEVSLL